MGAHPAARAEKVTPVSVDAAEETAARVARPWPLADRVAVAQGAQRLPKRVERPSQRVPIR